MPTNTFLSKNAKAKKTVARNMSIDAFIHASITTWATVNTDSAAISLTLLKDKSIALNHLNKLAKSCTMKTIVPPDQNADFLTISENTHAFTTQSQNVNSPMLTADTHMKKSSMSQSYVFLTLWVDAPTIKTAKTPTTSIMSLSIFPTMDLSESRDLYTTFIRSIYSFLFLDHSNPFKEIY